MTHLNQIRRCVDGDQQAVDELILKEMHSSVPLVELIGHHIIGSGGKRLRPLVVLLVARACGYQGENHQVLAAIIEFIHTATLLHDDVVDGSLLRRHQETANAKWGGSASVLVGDFIYSRAFQLIARLNIAAVTQVLAYTTNRIAEGEVLQLVNRHQAGITEKDYYAVIDRKTATLFAAATELAATIAGGSNELILACRAYGYELGLAFQLIDDALDYSENNAELGKNIGDDLAEGKMTLPLIYALSQVSATEAQLIEQAIVQGDKSSLPLLQEIIVTTKAIAYTMAAADKHVQAALAVLRDLPASDYKTALHALAEFVVARQY